MDGIGAERAPAAEAEGIREGNPAERAVVRRGPVKDGRAPLREPVPAAPARPETPKRPAAKREAAPQESDLYKLPLEERMRLYKKKYGGAGDRGKETDESRDSRAPNRKRSATADTNRGHGRSGGQKRPPETRSRQDGARRTPDAPAGKNQTG